MILTVLRALGGIMFLMDCAFLVIWARKLFAGKQ